VEGDTLELLAEIKRHAFIPSSQQTYTDAETLAVATSALRGYILPKLMARRGEFYFGPPGRVTVSVQEGVSLYRIPSRAVGAKVRSARLLDRQGNPIPLATYEWDDVSKWPPLKGTPEGLTMEGSQVRLYPEPQGLSGYTLELATYVRPGALALPADCVQVLSAVPGPVAGTTSISVLIADTPATMLDSFAFDVVSMDSPFESLAVGAPLYSFGTIGASYQFTVTGTLEVPPGSWLCLPGNSPVVQLPLEWHPMLALKAAATQLASLGDIGMSKSKLEELRLLEDNTGPLVTPRREDASRKVGNGMNKWRRGGFQW
jgi:hypothetical protein